MPRHGGIARFSAVRGSVMIVIAAGVVHAAVLMIPVSSAIEVPAVRVAVHVALMVTMPGNMYLAVLMVPMPAAVEVAPVRVAMHVTMMVTIPLIAIDVNFLDLVHDARLGRGKRPQRCRLCGY